MDDFSVYTTEDGSPTLYQPQTGISYRSLGGAITESQHVFIDGTNLLTKPSPWIILELGFGLGTNFQCAQKAATAAGVFLIYHSVEPAPVSPGCPAVTNPVAKEILYQLQTSRTAIVQTQHLEASVTKADWQSWQPQLPRPAQAIFHDPFGPKTSPDCWTSDCLLWERNYLADTGLWATYSSAGHVRRNLSSLGLFVGMRKGVGKKRQVLVASPSRDAIVGISDLQRVYSAAQDHRDIP